MKHSELPFSYKKQGKSAFYGIVSPDSDYYVAEELLEANAAFIVKAVNNHYQLIEALDRIRRTGFNGTEEEAPHKIAAEAIKQAEES